ncbi:alanine dehydrogenase [Teredinibacter turnerae T7901]|uniref:Alanine dehydrogenase n=1 Tax=Teredinibacter turnerae (strain ATCC 39867 / T7901) TaxID=377629 RepID=C5BTD1_TERTT|nr:alanine dehydrogenase [Teredinibacter turnerae]ACR12961.1 alanine dehydrogenase [Teredinibacter turnerae T7901]
MRIGVPTEIKAQEFRVGLTPAGVRELCSSGHSVAVQSSAGIGIGLSDEAYLNAGATIVSTAEEIFATSDMIIKVKEPQPVECKMLREGQILFTYLHLAPDPTQAKLLQDSGANAIAYETVTSATGGLPLLAPMSEVAGRLSIQAAAHCLEKINGGAGVLLGGVPGVPAGRVLVIGGGVVGLNAARIAMGMGAYVTIVDRSLARLKAIDEVFGPRIATLYSTQETIEQELQQADAVIGAVLVPGASAPKLVSQSQLALLKTGAVLVDVAIDQGGCFETSKPTTHQNPTYIVDGVVHYCVANMPGAVANTSTWALTNATLPYAAALANKGLAALKTDPHLRAGLNVANGKITHPAVAEALGETCYAAEEFIG